MFFSCTFGLNQDYGSDLDHITGLESTYPLTRTFSINCPVKILLSHIKERVIAVTSNIFTLVLLRKRDVHLRTNVSMKD